MALERAIVTGGAGFIGSHLVDALILRGTAVTVVDREDPRPERRNERATYVRMDIKDDGLRRVFEDAKPDVVFHLAAHVDDRESVRQPVMNAEENVLGSLHVFEAARQAGARKIVFASTGVVYGNADTIPTPETVLPQPRTPYGVSKLTGERYLHFFWLLYRLPYAALRLSNVYGPRQDGSKECGAVAIFTSRLLRGEGVLLHNDGATTRDYVHVDDAVAAFLAAASADAPCVVNVGTGIETATNDILAAVASAVGVTPSVIARPDVKDDVKRVALDVAAAKATLGWAPRVALSDGIARTVGWYKEVRGKRQEARSFV